MKGIILAAGRGTRLYPMTLPVCKPLLPVYDKPLIYYPLSVLISAGIRDVLIIVPPGEEGTFSALLGDGSQLGMHISYAVQSVARGIADALLIGADFLAGDSVCLALGDNIFHSPSLTAALKKAAAGNRGGTVFGYYVDDPRPFGVVEFDEQGRAVSIEEKPRNPKSNYIIPGLYFYDGQVSDIAADVKPSARGELEITSVNNAYLERGELSVELMGRGMAWLDTGTPEGLLKAAEYVEAVQSRQGYYIACLEEIAYRRGFIDAAHLRELGEALKKTAYGKYLLSVAEEEPTAL